MKVEHAWGPLNEKARLLRIMPLLSISNSEPRGVKIELVMPVRVPSAAAHAIKMVCEILHDWGTGSGLSCLSC